MIEVISLSKKYGTKVAVDNVSFQVPAGKVTGFLGPNGAGKSTTMRLIVGLDRPTSGEALVDGRRYADLDAPMHHVGTLLDAKSAHRARTARNHLRAVAATHGIGHRRIDEVIDLTGLSSVAKKRVGGFSLGMSQRLGIAVALLGDPQTLILDEPVNGLDPDGVTWMRELLRDLASEGRTVFLSSHLLGELALIAQQVIVIGRGRVIADMPVEELTRAQDRVRVRTPDWDDLCKVVVASGATFEVLEPQVIEIVGLKAEQVARLASSVHASLFEMTPIVRTLEQAYTELTRGVVEFEATDSNRR